jgi:hypothetical protein
MTGHEQLATLVEDTDLQGTGLPIDATLKLLLRGVDSPEVSSSCAWVWCEPNASSPTKVIDVAASAQYSGFLKMKLSARS